MICGTLCEVHGKPFRHFCRKPTCWGCLRFATGRRCELWLSHFDRSGYAGLHAFEVRRVDCFNFWRRSLHDAIDHRRGRKFWGPVGLLCRFGGRRIHGLINVSVLGVCQAEQLIPEAVNGFAPLGTATDVLGEAIDVLTQAPPQEGRSMKNLFLTINPVFVPGSPAGRSITSSTTPDPVSGFGRSHDHGR
jgi:hypothetical protein